MFADFPTEGAEHVRSVFETQIEKGVHHGAQLAVYKDGELVLDLAAGDVAPDGPAMEPSHRNVLFSCSKPYLALAVCKLVESGDISLSDRLVDYWPSFAESGSAKADITVRHVLTHQAGLPFTSAYGAPELWLDWSNIVDVMESADLTFEPGTDVAYHNLSYGWMLGELLRRVYDSDMRRAMDELVFEPLGLSETSLALGPDGDDIPVEIAHFDDPDRTDEGENLAEYREKVVGIYNQLQYRRTLVPAANCIGTARDLARAFYCVSNDGDIDGESYLDSDLVEQMLSVQVEVENEMTFDEPARVTLGLERAGTGAADMYGRSAPERVVGFTGAGMHAAWADPETGVAMAYVTNGMREDYEHSVRSNEVCDAVRAAFA